MADMTRFNSIQTRLAAVVLLVAIGSALFIGGAQPFAVGLIPAPWDKFAHAGLFAGISIAIGLATGKRGWRIAITSLCGALLLGMVDEWHQGFLPGRNPGWGDFAADAVGATAGALILMMIPRLRRRRAPNLG